MTSSPSPGSAPTEARLHRLLAINEWSSRSVTIALSACVLLYVVVFGFLVVSKSQTLQNSDDFAQYLQPLWTTAHGEPFRTTWREVGGPGELLLRAACRADAAPVASRLPALGRPGRVASGAGAAGRARRVSHCGDGTAPAGAAGAWLDVRPRPSRESLPAASSVLRLPSRVDPVPCPDMGRGVSPAGKGVGLCRGRGVCGPDERGLLAPRHGAWRFCAGLSPAGISLRAGCRRSSRLASPCRR